MTPLTIRADTPREAEWTAEPAHKVGRYIHIPTERAITPASGECIVDAWWSVHPEKGVAFYYQPFGYARSEEPSPQCNSNESAARALSARTKPDHEVVQLPVVFLEHARRAMEQDRNALRSATIEPKEQADG